jgi:hypothetical protein
VILESILILTNTTGRPLYTDIGGVKTPYVLGSYGLIVNADGLLESDANADAPTRQVNAVIEPGGYFSTWCKNNSATRSLADLYASPFKLEAVFGAASQQVSGQAQLATNTKGRREHPGRDVDHTVPLADQRRPDIHGEPRSGGGHARLLGPDSRNRGRRNPGEPHRPGPVQRVRVRLSIVAFSPGQDWPGTCRACCWVPANHRRGALT